MVTISWIDVKLGVRMLVKHPSLSSVAIIGMALAIAIGAGYFAFIGALLNSTLPIDKGERAILIRNQTVAGATAGETAATWPQDFVQWREQLKSVEELGAFRDERRNLITADGRVRDVRIAVITALAF